MKVICDKCATKMEVYRVEESYVCLRDENPQGSALIKYVCPQCDDMKNVTVGFDITNIHTQKHL